MKWINTVLSLIKKEMINIIPINTYVTDVKFFICSHYALILLSSVITNSTTDGLNYILARHKYARPTKNQAKVWQKKAGDPPPPNKMQPGSR